MRSAIRVLVTLSACSVVLTSTACLGDSSTQPLDELDAPAIRVVGAPLPWRRVGTAPTRPGSVLDAGIDSTVKRGGRASGYLSVRNPLQSDFAGFGQFVPAEQYRGRRIRWRAWVRTTDVGGAADLAGAGGGLWMRVDGPGVRAFDNMSNRAIRGTTDWTEYAVVLNVPNTATGLVFGALLTAEGDLHIDDGTLEIVDSEVPVTDLRPEPAPDTAPPPPDSGLFVSLARNLDFEGTALTDSSMSWFRSSVESFSGVAPGTADDDLAPFGTMIGDARLVALGESTHGTREFFRLKHRVFEYLVRRKGFTHFAIEGSWGEANEIDHYVQTGEGDPAQLLRKLGYWTWNTQEVLDLILWMRTWNTTASEAQRVRFQGFDMQVISVPADTLEAFFDRELPSQRAWLSEQLTCLSPHRLGTATPDGYRALPEAQRDACRRGLDSVATILAGYSGSASAPALQRARQSATVLTQWESYAAASPSQRTLVRDEAMANNVSWLLSQAPAQTRMMLWAHNGHVTTAGEWMGSHLRRTFGDQYRSTALLFGRGTFNAYTQGEFAQYGLRQWNVNLVPDQSYEQLFSLIDAEFLMFDARRLLTGEGAARAAELRGPMFMRAIGALFNPALESSYFQPQLLPDHFDHVFFVRNATRSVLLPFSP